MPLFGDQREKLEKFSDVLQHYMLQSEQLDTTLVLAADDKVAAGLLIQRLPMAGSAIWPAARSQADEDQIGLNEHYNRIAMLASSLKREELLTLDVDTILHRLFWEEQLLRFEPLQGERAHVLHAPAAVSGSAKMIVGLGQTRRTASCRSMA